MEIMNKYKKTIEELESHVENGRMRFNLLKQEFADEKRTTFLLTQKFESYELKKGKFIDDACATNSTSREASTLKDNVELMAQIELRTTPSISQLRA
jgi:hypothetical protein